MTRILFERADVIPLLAEVFRELGYEGTSITKITSRTGISKGSLYYFFPKGKKEMAEAVLEHIDDWFVYNVFEPLEKDEPRVAIQKMWCAVENYFQSGQRICLLGAFSLSETRDKFSSNIHDYFCKWIDSLCKSLVQSGIEAEKATIISEEIVGGIQGGIILAKALDDKSVFERTLLNLKKKIENYIFKAKEKN